MNYKFILFRIILLLLSFYFIIKSIIVLLLIFIIFLIFKINIFYIKKLIIIPLLFFIISNFILIIPNGTIPYCNEKYHINTCEEYFIFLKKIWIDLNNILL